MCGDDGMVASCQCLHLPIFEDAAPSQQDSAESAYVDSSMLCNTKVELVNGGMLPHHL